MSRRTSRPLRRRTGRAAAALTVVAVTAFGPSGPGLLTVTDVQAVGTVRQSTEAVLPAAVQVTGTVDPATAVPAADANPTTVIPGSAVAGTPTLPTTPATATATAVPPSAPTGSGIPGTVLAAYRNAEASLAGTSPGCRVSWSLIAGIGRVESGHASGGRVDEAGTTRGRILGPELNGTSTALIRDTDGGALDGDTAFDRAVGPMQFIPGTWKAYAKDGNRDGVASPHNVYDAALAAGTYLCAGGGDLSQPTAQRAALLRYNRSDAYGALVLRWAAAYAGGVSVLPNEQGEVPTTTPTPPAQVPTPAAGTIDPATSAALAAPAPKVTGTVASESSGGSSTGTTTTTITTTPTTSSTTTSTTAPTTSSTTTTTTPPTTTTTPTTTSPAGTSSTSAVSSTTKVTSTTKASSTTKVTSTTKPPSTTRTSTTEPTSTTKASSTTKATSTTQKAASTAAEADDPDTDGASAKSADADAEANDSADDSTDEN